MNTKGFTIMELMIVVAIMGILAAIIIPAFQEHSEQTERPTTEQPTKITSAPIKPIAESDGIKEQCINGIMYLFVIKGGENFMSPKQDRWGDNERCYE
jgi:type IV pilus assembly protein PilA